MAHSCRWRFPARPGTTGGGGGGGRRGLGGAPRQRVPALLLPPGPAGGGAAGAPPSPAAAAAGSGGAAAAVGAAAASAAPAAPAASSAPSAPAAPAGPALLRVGPGFDAALQVSAAIGTNLRRFRAVFGESGGGGGSGELTTQIPCSWRTKGLIHDKKTEPFRLLAWSWCLNDEQFLGFGSDEEVRVRSPTRSPSAKSSPRKPRGRPRSGCDRSPALLSDPPAFPPLGKPETKPADKIRKKDSKSLEKKRGRPPTFPGVKIKITHGKDVSELPKGSKEDSLKKIKRTPSATFQQATKIKKLRAGKLSPLKSKFKAGKLQIGRKGVQIVRRRGRPPSTERVKAPAGLLLGSPPDKPPKARRDADGAPAAAKDDKTVRQSPRRVKPVRIIPSSKRTDAAIAKQLLQRAKKGAQKKIEKEAAQLQGRKAKTQVKNIRQFIMPVVSAISSRIIKTPRRFIEDEDYDPPIKIARLEPAPGGRFGAASCGSSDKSSAASQHSSQLSSDSSRSSSPSVDTSTDSQASEEMPGLPEEQGHTPEAHAPLPAAQAPESDRSDRRGRRYSASERSFGAKAAKKLSALPSAPPPPAAPASPPPPLLSPPPPLQPAAGLADATPWLLPPTIPLASPFLPAPTAPLQGKRKSILREPTFRWTSLKHSRAEPPFFSSAKYAKEGLIRKPVFDNFRPPPLTPEDVGFAAGFSAPGAARLFAPLHAGPRFDVHKRSPLLRAPRFTPSEAHSRIFESVTLPGGRAPAAPSRKRKRRVFSPLRAEPRSPSHSMRTRSGRLSAAELSPLTPPPGAASLSLAASPHAASALSPAFTFPAHPLAPGEATEKAPRPRRPGAPAEPFAAGGPAPLFPWFTPGAQADRGRARDRAPEEPARDRDAAADKPVEKDKGRERDREREKENKRESRKEKRRKGSEIQAAALFPAGRAAKDKAGGEEAAASSSAKKVTGRKKSSSLDPGPEVAAVTLGDSAAVKTKILIKKGRGSLDKAGLDLGAAAPPPEKEKALCLPAPGVKHSAPSIGSMLAQADKLPMTDKRVASLLKKAKAQLCKIEKSKSLKQTDQPKAQGQESDSSETSVRGPRIKHVCRRAAVALGRKRAVFPDDMPTLSALPWEEREKILSSMGNDDKSSIAGSEDAEPLAPPIKPIKPVTRNKVPQEPPVKKGRRSRRCGQCPGCQVPEDCGVCTNCLDKPKFGGRNIKKQCCKMRKCQNLQWMPSKAYLQKQAKDNHVFPLAVKKKEKKSKSSEKKESKENSVVKSVVDASQKPLPSAREDPVPKKSSSEPPPRKHTEEKSEEGPASAPAPEPKQAPTPASRKSSKQASQPAPAPAPPPQPPSTAPPRKDAPKAAPSEPKKKQPLPPDPGPEQSKQKKVAPRPSIPVKQKPKEKEKPPPVSKQENAGTLNTLSTLSSGGSSKQKVPADGVHRIRVDFKEDCEAENVWEMGGLGILTSLPITPRVVCFLCASSGHVEFVYCQVCCEPFHRFCLEENERPLEDQLENWCCRRCKFCHVCGRQHQATKQLLECNKCRNSYHPECLGPNYPTKPTKKKKVWICTKCVRCKSCGSTTPGKGWDAQWSHDFSLCHDCAKLFAKGNFCPLCDKCYDDDDYESKMMQCGKCDRWVHSKCENLSGTEDEMYEILSNLPESVAYTCVNCTVRHPAEWRLALATALQASLKQVLTALLNSRTTSHLLRYRQAAKPPDLNPETEESIPSRSSPEGPDPPVLTEVSKQEEPQPVDLEGVKKKMDQGNYTSVLEFSDDIVKIIQAAINADGGQPELKKANSMVKSFFIRQMERVFPWFSVKKSRFWEPNKVSSNSGMLPNAVLPPSLDHNYAQWQEREDSGRTEQPPLMKKIIPAPKPKGPGEPDSPTPPHPPTPPALSTDRSREDSPELNPPPGIEDNRQCALCLTYGDDGANDAGRLLYIGQNEWTHVNCALWSAEVFEDDDGSLKNVHMAVIRGKQLRCEFCQKPGATVGCCLTSCTSNYHFMCSRATRCVFLDDKKVYCQRHRDLIKGEVVPENGFEVFRRVFVDFEGISLRRKFLNGLEPENIHMMIGSMTIDCLGILNDLSDCEDKLFPVGYQCSRVYWSTTDARRRCVYTCRIVACRPPAAEPDINSTVEHDENRTVAHSPTSSAEMSSKESQNAAELVSPSSPDRPPHMQTSGSCFYHVISKVPRIRTPSYSPTQRSPGCRPLPSAGSPTPTTHEIVTVGDPLLSSGLRSIGSRRHSAPSSAPQASRLRMMSPVRAGSTHSKNSGPSASASAPGTAVDLEASAKAADRVLGPLTANTNLRQNAPTAPGSQRTVVTIAAKASHGDGSATSETKHPSASDLAASSSLKGEKAKLLSSKGSEGAAHSAAHPGIPRPAPQRHGHSLPSGEPSVSKMGTFAEFSAVPFSSREALPLPPLHLRGQRNDRDLQPDPTPAGSAPAEGTAEVRALKLSGVGGRSSLLGEHVGSRDRRPKGKKSGKETSREKRSGKSFLEPGQVATAEEGSLTAEFADEVLPPAFPGPRPCNSVSSDEIGDRVLASPGVPKAPSMQGEGPATELQTPRKRTVKVTLTPLKMEGESQSRNALKEHSPASSLQAESASPSETVSTSESPGAGPVAQPSPGSTASQEPPGNSYQPLPVQDRNLLLPDGPKPQEDGSFKRRYPRRSARARSNMFFGLTPLYGVRSYGEEDLPFYSSSTGKKRGKRSAEGQVDGADDLSTSDEDDLYYYNFTRTVIAAGAEERLAAHGLFREEEQCDLPRISQLDGIDDGTESDTSVTATTRKTSQIPKRNGKENGTESLKLDRPEDGEKEHVIKSSGGHKSEPKAENCHPVSRGKGQGQDSLEAQLSSLESSRRVHASAPSDKALLDTYNPELLKSDSDNNNSDDCGNILPSDIMDFVLKNTPSMQALGESPESSSSELLNLGEGLGLDSNREKDIGLFEVFSQQLPTAEPVDSSVSSSISAEEQFELPLELPSDLSVLTTRSPTVPGPNPGRLAVIADAAEERVAIPEKPVAASEEDPALLSPGVDPAPEGHMTPDRFIQGHMDADLASPPCGAVEQSRGSSQDLTRSSSTPSLQVPAPPTVPGQSQKYGPSSAESPGPSQISNAAVQTTPPHLKPPTEKLIVVNQNMQPLYVLQTLPNGVTQKIQLTSSVSSAPGVMEANTSVLGPMGGGLALTAGLTPGLQTPQPLFPPAGKGLLPVPHHQHLHPFPTAAQGSFPPTISSSPPGLLIGVQPSPDPQLLVSEASQRTDLSTTVVTPSSGLKKRPISRLQTRKNKKLAPSSTPSSIAPSDVVSNMTLINFTPSQLPNHPNLLDLGSLNTSSHRTVPNIIKRSKSGVMYFEQAPLLPQTVGGPATATGTSTGSQDTGHLASGPMAGLASGSSVLNVVSMQTTTAPTSSASVPGHVTLASPRLLGAPDTGPISSLLIKASQQGLGLQDRPGALPPSSGMFPQLGSLQTPSTSAMTAASGVCVLPATQTGGLAAASPSKDTEDHYQHPHVSQLLANKVGVLPSQRDADTAPGAQGPSFAQAADAPSSRGLEPKKAAASAGQARTTSPAGSQSSSPSVPGPAQPKPKSKRLQLPSDKGSGKKHKASHLRTSSSEAHVPDQDAHPSSLTSSTGQMAVLPEVQTTQNPANEQESTDLKAAEEEDGGFSSPLMLWLQQEQKRKESITEKKPKKGLVFEISSDDGFQICAESIEDAWKSLTDKVQEARSNARLKQLSFAGVSGLRMLGILHDAVVFLTEQLPGAKHCRNYKFRFHKPEEANEPPLNPHGSARAEVHLRKSAFDMFNFLASKHRQPPEYNPHDEEEEEVQLKSARRATSMDLPMPMRFRHLKKTSKEAVGVYRSPIHGRGLFCKRNIDAGEMVIEYAGNVIRSIQTDKREKYYDSKGIGCYMFRIDDSEVVDATMHGNAARFINHSCEPNCYSRVINIDGQKHIVIFAMRKIYRGEELTYDYKFPIEDASNKLPCNCGAKKCRKFLN
ncbi:histone-lysine N-methyltransferase 2A isoform X5 [Pipistrellus kuhlii]|uniref:histone-lysine N-methyltransferase 2A isoform X5 n=1 Tax=Pipistrellus kuhlii TaxID=59472 RepID=UPI001E26F049|nr:histone-lysine N-methyltransferase 2A isoform X5 [Pipistrellus kuhlii]